MKGERPSKMWGRCTAGNWDVPCSYGNHDRIVEVEAVVNAATMRTEFLCKRDAEGYRLLNRLIVPGDRRVPAGNVRWHLVDRRPPPRAVVAPPDPW